jgi:Zn-dependent M28 family amino/carboxypeptidase
LKISGCLLPLILIFNSYSYAPAQIQPSDSINTYIETAGKIVSTALENRKAYSLLRDLCILGPRLSGSVNSLKAIHWVEVKMKELGFENIWLQPVMVPHWERGKVEEAVITNGKFSGRKINICALGGSVGTDRNGITAPVIEVKELNKIDSLKEKVKGKIVFINEPMDERLISTFPAYGKAVGKRVFGAIKAAQYGAVGVIIRSITTKFDNVPHTGVMYYNDTIPKIPGVAAGYRDSDFLSSALIANPYLKLNLKLSCKTLPDAQSYNVIGEIKGSEFPDDIIVIGAHIDSWDKGTGAHDDGAGCMQSVEVLDLMKRLNLKPKRTIRCVLFINEENGSRGAEVYGTYADTANERHVAAIESDAGGFTPRGFSVSADSTILARIQSWLPILKICNIEQVEKGGSGADINDIRNAAALIGYHPDSQRYFDFHHSDNDVFEAVNPRELELGAAAIAVLAYLISQEGL